MPIFDFVYHLVLTNTNYLLLLLMIFYVLSVGIAKKGKLCNNSVEIEFFFGIDLDVVRSGLVKQVGSS